MNSRLQRFRHPAALLAAAFACQHAIAASSTSNAVTPSGDDVKVGDNIFFSTDTAIFTQIPAPPATAPATPPTVYYCAPAGYRFVVQSITPASTQGGTPSNPQPAATTLIKGYFPGGRHPLHRSNSLTAQGCNGASRVQFNTPYQFTSQDFSNTASQRGGFTWGAMIIPYKYYFTDHSIQGNPSTVAYVGYEGWFPGVSLAAVGAAGLGLSPGSSNAASASGATPNNATTASASTAATYTVALGVIATFGASIKAGVLLGRDYQSNAAAFKYQNKTWVALSVGASF